MKRGTGFILNAYPKNPNREK